jgi:phosphinothricin acetyltransferase
MNVRLASVTDAEGVAAIYAPVVRETIVSFEERAPDTAEMAERIGRCLPRYPWLVGTDDAGGLLGYVYAGPHRERAGYRWSVDVTAYVAAEARGRGVAKRLYASLLAMLTVQLYRRAYAGVTQPNDASVALHRSAGFVPFATYRNVGYKFGAWHDVLYLERELGPAVVPPPEPLPLAAIDVERLLRDPDARTENAR